MAVDRARRGGRGAAAGTPRPAAASRSSPPWPAWTGCPRSAGRCCRSACSPGIWELCWAMGWADPQLLPPPHIFLGNFAEQAQVLQHRDALADRRRRNSGPSALRGRDDHRGATTMRVFVGLVIASVLAIGIGVLIRYSACLRQAGAADHHAALAGVADRLAAGGDLPVRHRQRAGDLHGRGGAVLPHGAGDHHPDRRRQPQPDQRRAHHGRVASGRSTAASSSRRSCPACCWCCG